MHHVRALLSVIRQVGRGRFKVCIHVRTLLSVHVRRGEGGCDVRPHASSHFLRSRTRNP